MKFKCYTPKRRRSSIKTKDDQSINANVFQRVFEYFDSNKDGKISVSELRNSVRKIRGDDISEEAAEAAIRSLDLDGDGELGYEDFKRLMECNGDESPNNDINNLTDLNQVALREAFRMYETEPGSGIINPSSLKRMLSRLDDHSPSIEDCKAMIRPFDLNGDGILSFQEFSLMMR